MDTVLKTPNKELMAQARESLKGSWGSAIGMMVVYLLVSGVGVIPFLGAIASLIITGPLMLGLVTFFLALSRKQPASVSQLFKGFDRFGTALGTYLLQSLFVLLWTLLLIVPGIIAGISYSMTFYILADNPSMGPREAIRKSKEIMRGNKWKLCCLAGRFCGWWLLCILTLGIGFLWLLPYMNVSYAKFYEDIIKKEKVA